MKVAIVNTPTSVGPAGWAGCFDAARRQANVFGLNEVLSRRAKRMLRRRAKRAGFGSYGTRQGPNPVFWDNDRWKRVSGRVVQLHGRLTRYDDWPGFNDARYVTEVVLERRDGRGREVAVLCWHGVPNGPKVLEDDRARCRAGYVDTLSAMLADHQADGREAWLIGDTNIHGEWQLDVPRFVWVQKHTIDKAGVALPAHLELDQPDGGTFPAPTDHKHGTRARGRLRRRRPPRRRGIIRNLPRHLSKETR